MIDLGAPKGSSIDTIRSLREQAPGTEIVVSTMEPSPLFARQALAAGALGFVLKDRADTELLTAVRHAARGTRRGVRQPAGGRRTGGPQFALRRGLIGV